MKKLGLLVLFCLLSFPVNAQDSGALLLFAVRGEQGTSTLYSLNADTGVEQLIADSVDDAGWSPDGRVWMVDTVNKERHLRFIDVDSGAESTFDAPLSADTCFASVLWSPKGTQLAYFSGDENERILTMLNVADGSHYQMPTLPHTMPRWSSNENYVLINEPIVSSPFRLLRASDGQEVLNDLRDAVFSPDSRYLAYGDAEETMWVYTVTSGKTRNLAIRKSYPIPVWSPSGRYVIFDVYPSAERLDYYDTQRDSLEQVDLGYPVDFATWAADEDSLLLYADDVDHSGDVRPTTLLSYNLASRESTVVLENTKWVGSVRRNGDWTAVRYSLTPLENRYSPTTHLLVYKGETHAEFELLVADSWQVGPSILNFEDGFLIAAQDGLHRFDNQTLSLDTVYAGNSGYPYPTADGNYVAFVTANEGGFFNNLTVWNAATKRISTPIEAEKVFELIGWRGSPQRTSLLYCGVG